MPYTTPPTDPVESIRKALEAGPTDGPWIPCETADEKHMAWVTDGTSSIALVGAIDPDTANANAVFIAACNPAAIRALLERLDRAELNARRYEWLRSLPVELPSRGVDVAFWKNCEGEAIRGEKLDKTIDQAMKGKV